MDGDRPRRPHVGRGLVPRLRLAAVRPDAVARSLGGTYTTASPTFDVAGAGLAAVAKRLGLTGFDVKRLNDPGLDPNGGLRGLQSDVPRRSGGGVTQVLTGARHNASLLGLLALIARRRARAHRARRRRRCAWPVSRRATRGGGLGLPARS